jgi:hypothetical protein
MFQVTRHANAGNAGADDQYIEMLVTHCLSSRIPVRFL